MTRNILGLHLQGNAYYSDEKWLTRSMEELRDYIQWIWLMDPGNWHYDSPFPHQKCGVRFFPVSKWNDIERECVSHGADGAQRWINWMLPRYEGVQRWATCLQGPNEVAVGTYDQRMRLNEFAVELYRLCLRHGIPLAFGGCFGVGWPGGESASEHMDWTECIKRDTIQLLPTYDHCDYIVSHHYGKRDESRWAEMQGWTLRYRMVQDVLDAVTEGGFNKPRLITEGGLDQIGNKDTSGWRGPGGPSRAEYVKQVMGVCDEIANDKNVQCYELFTALSAGWPSFRVERPDWEAFAREIVKREPYGEPPAGRPLPHDELGTKDPLTLTEKTRWFTEELKRNLVEGRDVEYGMSIADELPALARAAEVAVHNIERSTLPPDVSS